MQSVFWMTDRDRLEEAAEWLEGLGCLIDMSPSEAWAAPGFLRNTDTARPSQEDGRRPRLRAVVA
jgi:hypothetical protein